MMTIVNDDMNPVVSATEEEIADYIKEIYPGPVATSVRGLLPGDHELDIYLPTECIGIEFHGLYWHSNLFKDETYHKFKLDLAHEMGIHLIQIFEDEWLSKQDLVKNKLAHILGVSKAKSIGAREMHIKEINRNMDYFHNFWNIEGSHLSDIAIGLYDGTELYASMSFVKMENMEEDESIIYELSRYTVRPDVRIPGGFSKLLNHFINNYKCSTIIAFADQRWVHPTDNVYIKTGFQLEEEIKPQPWYFHRSDPSSRMKPIIYNKYSTIMGTNKSNKTSVENQMKNEGHLKIYDSGHLKFRKEVEV